MIVKFEAIVKCLDITTLGRRINRVYNTEKNNYEIDTTPAYDVRNSDNQRELLECLEFIPLFFSKEFARRGTPSSIVKQFLEKMSAYRYISNASVILAFNYLDYPITKYDDDNDRDMNIRGKKRYEIFGDDLQEFIRSLRIDIRKTTSDSLESETTTTETCS